MNDIQKCLIRLLDALDAKESSNKESYYLNVAEVEAARIAARDMVIVEQLKNGNITDNTMKGVTQ